MRTGEARAYRERVTVEAKEWRRISVATCRAGAWAPLSEGRRGPKPWFLSGSPASSPEHLDAMHRMGQRGLPLGVWGQRWCRGRRTP